MLTLFPVSKTCPKMNTFPKMEFFGNIREHMKTWTLMQWEASIVASSCMLIRNSVVLIFSGMVSLDKHTASILLCTIFRNLCTKLLESPLPQHALLFPIQCFCSWHFTHQKNASSLLSSVQMLSIPQDPDQSHSDKLSLVTAIWNDLSTFLTPTMFTIYDCPQSVTLRPPASKMHDNLYFYKHQKELWQFSHCFHKLFCYS